MTARALTLNLAGGLAVGALLGLLAFAIFGPLVNLVLWAFAERWYFPGKIPLEFGFRSGGVFSPRGGAVSAAPASGSRS